MDQKNTCARGLLSVVLTSAALGVPARHISAVASGSWPLPRFLCSRIPLRLKARGSPSVARPFGGANVHWTFAFFRLTLRSRDIGSFSAPLSCFA